MGEFADMALDQGFLNWLDGLEDDMESDYWSRFRKPRCYRCNALCNWAQTPAGNWRLYEGLKPHCCTPAASVDDFP